MQFDFGGPTNGIFQSGFIVEDLDASMEQFSQRLRVGPWTTMRGVGPQGQTYRGAPATAKLDVAFAFGGHMLYELIHPADDEPSIYQEAIKANGYGFHHFGYATTSFDEDVAALQEEGYEVVSTAEVPGLRLAHFDTRDILPGLTELIEASDSVNSSFTGIWRASIGHGEPESAPPAPPSDS
jgi:hypothetical protein